MWDDLPTEITTNILLRLPIKTLIICTCLSKSYLSLITSHEFINTHLAENSNNTQFFLRYLTKDGGKEKYHLEPDNDNFVGFQSEGLLLPFDSNGDWFTVAGCVNGVLCLVNDCRYEGTLIILWNPSIRKYVHVPRPHYVFKSYGGYESACGFGFDSVTNDYKVVRVVELLDREPYSQEREVEIYSLRSGCWRNVGIGPKYRIRRRYDYIPCFFHGSVHWVGSSQVSSTKRENVILKFDMSIERFETIEVPCMLKENKLSCTYTPLIDFYVLECKGMLALVRRNYNDNNLKTCTVWVMKEYGVVNSWTKMFEFKYGNVYTCRVPMAFGFRNNGEVIIVKRGNYYEEDKKVVVSFNLAARDETMLGELTAGHIDPCSFYLCTYVESMALFKEGKRIDDHTKLLF